MAEQILNQVPSNVVPFIPGYRPPVRPRMQSVDYAVFEVEQAAHDLSVSITSARTLDEALALRRIVAALVKKLNDVEQLALVRASQIVEAERVS